MVQVAPTAFKVLTEFRFETGAAVISSKKLQDAVDGISQSADDLLFTFQRVSFGIVGSFISGPGGGILGVLATAISSSETLFQLTQSRQPLILMMLLKWEPGFPEKQLPHLNQ